MADNDLSNSLAKRIVRAIIRRIRHQILLHFVRAKSNAVIKSVGKIDHILVLCYGNIYRSPLVEYLLREALSDTSIEIRSAGFYDKTGRSCSDEYLSLLSERGYNLKAHRSRKISQEDIAWADIILIMDRKNWDLLSAMDSTALTKTVWIGAFSPNLSVEVGDPYGQGVEVTQKIIAQLEQSVVDVAGKILDKSQPGGGFVNGSSTL
jgi:protein-tyrosine phosphatase